MENRDTKTITTPIGKNAVVIKTWLTGREKRGLTNVFIDTLTSVEKGTEGLKLNSDIVNKAQDLAFEIVIENIDGNKENIVDKILDMRTEDFDFIVAEINKITNNEVDETIKKK